MDKISKEKRSVNMAQIKSGNTKPELFIRHELHRLNLRYRVNYRPVKGSPDLYFSKIRLRSSFMAVSGIDTKSAPMLLHHLQILNSGRKNFQTLFAVISQSKGSYWRQNSVF